MKAPSLALALVLAASATPAHADVVADAKQSFQDGVNRFFTDQAQPAVVVANLQADAQLASKRQPAFDAAASRAPGPIAGHRASARAQPLESDGTATLTKRAGAAIKTDLEDVEAGVQVAPLLLAGYTSPAARGWSVTAASLEDTRFRIGTGYRLAVDEIGVGPRDLGIKDCQRDDTAHRAALDALADDFAAVCVVVAARPASTQRWLNAAAACGVPAPGDLSPAQTAAYGANRTSGVYAKLTAVERFMVAGESCGLDRCVSAAFERLEKVRISPPSRTSCLDDDALAAAVTRAKWSHRDRAFGISASVDFFPITGGFDVDPSTDDSGLTAAGASAQLEYKHSTARLSGGVGLGAEMSREARGDDATWAVKANASFDFVLARLDGGDLTDGDGALNLVDGKLPPLFSIGIDLKAVVPTDPDDQHVETLDLLAVDEMSATVFADLRFTDELAVRIGVPFTREAATRESDGKRALVWTVPVFLTTVLAL